MQMGARVAVRIVSRPHIRQATSRPTREATETRRRAPDRFRSGPVLMEPVL